jgi:hypothetical protein
MELSVEEITRLYNEQGLSLVNVAKQLGVSHTTIQRFKKRHGIPSRPVGRKPYPDDFVRVSKVCTYCKELKPIDQFYRNKTSRDGHSTMCCLCDRPRREKNRLRQKYGTTPFFIEKLHEAQKGLCGICGATQAYGSLRENYAFHIDHDHATNTVRGLLCNRCNLGIGTLGDSLELFRKAVAYLENPPASKLLTK